jgi:TPR repeat protein
MNWEKWQTKTIHAISKLNTNGRMWSVVTTMKNTLSGSKKAAYNGHVEAQWWLGELYEYGDKKDVLPENQQEAVRWYQESAAQGYASAQYSLGQCYARSSGGVEKSLTKAIEWFTRACENTNSDIELRALANFRLGLCYDDRGDDSTEMTEKTKEHFEKAAEYGHAVAKLYMVEDSLRRGCDLGKARQDLKLLLENSVSNSGGLGISQLRGRHVELAQDLLSKVEQNLS